MVRKQDGLVPIGEALADLDGPVKAIRDATPPGGAPLHPLRSGEPACLGQRSGRRSRLHCADDGAVQLGRAATPGNQLQYKRVNGPYTLIM